MITVITPEEMIHNEIKIINELFQEGLDLLHVRKPLMGLEGMTCFIQEINSEFHHQLVLHSHYDLVKTFEISRFHFREIDRQNEFHKSFKDKIISTSVHDIDTFNELNQEWEYSFISPVFPSISKKGYGENSTIFDTIKNQNNPAVKLVALGGINEKNIHQVINIGVDGVALLGAVWDSDQPLNAFRACSQKFSRHL